MTRWFRSLGVLVAVTTVLSLAVTTANGNAAISGCNRARLQRTPECGISATVTAKDHQKQKGKIVVKVKVKAREHLDAKGTGNVKIRMRDGCEPEPRGRGCKAGFKLQRVDKRIVSGRKKTLKLKATDAGNRRLVKHVENGYKAKARLKITLSDEAGNSEKFKFKVKLKPSDWVGSP